MRQPGECFYPHVFNKVVETLQIDGVCLNIVSSTDLWGLMGPRTSFAPVAGFVGLLNGMWSHVRRGHLQLLQL